MTDDDKLKLAREAAGSVRPYSHNSALILDGERDGTDIVQSALAAINALDPQLDEAVGLLRGCTDELADGATKAAVDTFLAKQGDATMAGEKQ